ncbi:hypothetical protein GCM10009777_40110 [Microbacterium pumilum]|uniref:Uncharacterized protein n=1 Tax=Microbacterium pumilum TaxID=344165 RepID=A0ABP5EIK8_9MICO
MKGPSPSRVMLIMLDAAQSPGPPAGIQVPSPINTYPSGMPAADAAVGLPVGLGAVACRRCATVSEAQDTVPAISGVASATRPTTTKLEATTAILSDLLIVQVPRSLQLSGRWVRAYEYLP